MSTEPLLDLAILGGGFAGLAAARAAALRGLRVAVLARRLFFHGAAGLSRGVGMSEAQAGHVLEGEDA